MITQTSAEGKFHMAAQRAVPLCGMATKLPPENV
jgi:hypothetical protein